MPLPWGCMEEKGFPSVREAYDWGLRLCLGALVLQPVPRLWDGQGAYSLVDWLTVGMGIWWAPLSMSLPTTLQPWSCLGSCLTMRRKLWHLCPCWGGGRRLRMNGKLERTPQTSHWLSLQEHRSRRLSPKLSILVAEVSPAPSTSAREAGLTQKKSDGGRGGGVSDPS